jgi:phosphoribosylformylglycinamidine synthase
MDLIELVRGLVAGGVVEGVHDISDGGLGVALAEMALRSGVGFVLDEGAVPDHVALFSEAPSRVVVCVDASHVEDVRTRAAAAGVAVADLGTATSDRLVIPSLLDVALADAKSASESAIPNALTPATH